MSDEEKIAQLFAISSQSSQKSYDQIFEVFFPGGILDYKNIKPEKKFYKRWFDKIDKLQDISLKKTKLPLLYMVNQEGGDISRLKRDFFIFQNPERSYWDIPSPLKMAQVNDLKLVEKLAMETGRLLLTLGVNMNLAPVVDVVHSEEGLEFMRGRSFGSDPHQVKRVSQAFTAGFQKVGVIAAFKHFPGYTNSKLNSHNDFVSIPLPKQTFKEKHWIPYQFKSGWAYPKAVMSNIALYPQLDDQSTAPLSKKIITGILKEELNYKGLILTDDIGMSGYKEPDRSKRAIQAFLAGHDMILATTIEPLNLIRIYKDFLKAFKQGQIPKSRVEESLRKVLQLKSQLPHNKAPLEKRIKQIEESKKRIYQINEKLTQAMLNSVLKKNPQLKQSLSKDMSIISFSEESYRAVESLGYFKNHEKNLKYLQNQDKIHLSKPQKKPPVKKTEFHFSDQRIGFCYGKITKYCHLHFSRPQKKFIVMIDTRNTPLTPKLRKQYKLYVPAYGAFPKVGEMFLQQMIQP